MPLFCAPYQSQAWIFSGTARDNIIAGMPFDSIRYNGVIESLALDTDFDSWSFGDLTTINPSTLSGGQKQVCKSLSSLFIRKEDFVGKGSLFRS
jgi:hypothetical protein